MREREGLVARVRQMRRASASQGEAVDAGPGDAHEDQIRVLETRIADLEALVQGLQDSVHREFSRHQKRISDLETRIQPAALGQALTQDARARGL